MSGINARLPTCLMLLKKRKKGVIYFENLLAWNYWANCKQTLVEWSLDGFLTKLCPASPTNEMTATTELSLTKGQYVKFIWKSSCLKLPNQLKLSFGGMVLGWSSNKIVSGLPVHQSRCSPQPNLVKHRTLWKIQLKIFLSKTIETFST